MIKAIIVDDEDKARQTLQYLTNMYCKDVEIVADFSSIEEAENFILSNPVDLIFLDIEMPEGTGLHLAKKISDKNIGIIFITAHPHYAIKAIKVDAIDYLLKPVDVEELQHAVERFKNSTTAQKNNTKAVSLSSEEKNIVIPTREGLIYLKQDAILYISAEGSYSNIFHENERICVSKNLAELETQLDTKQFFRCHNSQIINLKKVKSFNKIDGYFAEMQNGAMVEISRRKKDDFLNLMGINK
jgi:two-component system LytT family response regulator